MYRQLDDFFQAYGYQAESTAKILTALTDESLGRSVAEDHRVIGGIAWHIVTSAVEMMKRTGLSLGAVQEDSMPPTSAAEIAASYKRVSNELLKAVREGWTDATLLETDDMYGEPWERGKTLAILIHHEIHHRGQMTVLMRQAGLKVPGVFGPSKEEWGAYGMEAPPY